MNRQHWEDVHAARPAEALSWFQQEPALSLALIEAAGVAPGEPVIDIGGGSSLLVDRLLERGFSRITVLDVARNRLGPRQARVTWRVADVTDWQPPAGAYALWHDRAVFHFLVEEPDREAYLRALHRGLAAGGHAIFGTFAASGPQRCSGLPVQRYSADSLQSTLGEAFDLLDARLETHHTPAGRAQDFQWCLFRRRATGREFIETAPTP